MSKGPHVSEDQIIEIIERVAEGISLKASCVISKLSLNNINRRITESKELKALLARAREDYQDIRVAEMNEIAVSEPDVQRARLICDNIKWEAARISPKKYGDKQTIEHDVTDEVAALMRARARVSKMKDSDAG